MNTECFIQDFLTVKTFTVVNLKLINPLIKQLGAQ
jgi:hypothetical protein